MNSDDTSDLWVGMDGSGSGKHVGKRLGVSLHVQPEDRNHS